MKSSLQRSSWLVVAAFLLPSLLGFLLFMAIPMIAAFGISLTNYAGGWGGAKFIGLTNYTDAFTSAEFPRYLGITITFTFWTVFIQLTLGLVFALILN